MKLSTPLRSNKPADAAPPVPAATWRAHPALAPGVEVHPPEGDDARWVLKRADGRYFRVGGDLAALVRALDGQRDHSALAEQLGAPWTAAQVAQTVAQLDGQKLLDDGQERRAPRGWFVFRPPATLQFTLVKPERFLQHVVPLVSLVWNRAGAALAAFLAIGGLLAIALRHDELHRLATEPLPMGLYFLVLLAMVATTLLHELGHGAVLAYYGGRPSRMGMMLLYLFPVFFCDVSDAWRFSDKRHRVHVALAGPMVQVLVGGGAALASYLATSPALRDGMMLFAVAMYVAAAINLIPFARFDGYIAFMSQLDIPNLRVLAMEDARRAMARLAYGGEGYERGLPGRWWAVPFGILCMGFPLYLIGIGLALWTDLFASIGRFALVVIVAGLGYFLCYRGFLWARRAITEARAAGASAGRVWVGSLAIVGLLVLAGATIQVPHSVHGRFYAQPDGGMALLLSSESQLAEIPPAARVTLSRRGLLLSDQRGSAVVAEGGPALMGVPLEVWFAEPEPGGPEEVEALALPLVVGEDPGITAGGARVDVGSRPVAAYVYETYLAPLVWW